MHHICHCHDDDEEEGEDDGVVLDGMDEGLRKSTWRLIASVALPASLANASPVLLTTAQTALLGHGKGGAVALAAYGWVLTSSGGRLRALSSLALALTLHSGPWRPACLMGWDGRAGRRV